MITLKHQILKQRYNDMEILITGYNKIYYKLNFFNTIYFRTLFLTKLQYQKSKSFPTFHLDSFDLLHNYLGNNKIKTHMLTSPK